MRVRVSSILLLFHIFVIMNCNLRKRSQLGMPVGTAMHRLRKSILFELVRRSNLDICFQCGVKIETVEELSIEHKIPFLDSEDPVKMFFDLDNIAFSHLRCNVDAARVREASICGTENSYKKGCRCDKCREIKRITIKEYRRNRKNKFGGAVLMVEGRLSVKQVL